MLTKTKWILAGGAAAVALSPVAAFASGFDANPAQQGTSVASVQAGSLAADAEPASISATSRIDGRIISRLPRRRERRRANA